MKYLSLTQCSKFDVKHFYHQISQLTENKNKVYFHVCVLLSVLLRSIW